MSSDGHRDGHVSLIDEQHPAPIGAWQPAAQRVPPGAVRAATVLLDELGILSADHEVPDGMAETPARFAAALAELCAGLDGPDPGRHLERTFPPAGEHPSMITAKGLEFVSVCLPSRQLVNAAGGVKRACNVRPGDRLWTLADGRAEQTTVTGTTARPSRELVRVTTETGTFLCTPDHPFATPGGWAEAAALAGQFVEWTEPRSLCRRRYQPVTGYDFGYAVGAVTSDGSVSPRAISFVVNDPDFAKRFAGAFTAASGVHPEIEPVTRPSGHLGRQVPGYRVRIISSYLAELFRQYLGGDAHHMRQRFPRVVMADLATFLGFLDGYVDGDGCRPAGRRGRWSRRIVSGNEPFLREVAEVTHSRSFTRQASGGVQLGVADSWVRKHGFSPESHRTDLAESQWSRVLSADPVTAGWRKPYTVYSFTCSPHPTFLVGGHLSHNCEHHLLPFYGTAAVAYLPEPGARVVGISKLARLVSGLAARPQMQEHLGAQVVAAITARLAVQGAACTIDAVHTCMTLRGARAGPDARMITNHLAGRFLNEHPVREEFLALTR